MDESDCFFKALPNKALVGKCKKGKGGKKSKQRFTTVLFVNAAGEKVEEAVVIWKSGMPRKSRMASDVMLAVLKKFNKKLIFEERKMIFLLDNATCNSESMVDLFSQIKVIFPFTNSTSILQSLDACITQNLKFKYMKGWFSMCLQESMKTLLQREGCKYTDVIQWAQEAWKEVTGVTIK